MNRTDTLEPVHLIQYWHEESPPDYIVELLRSFGEQNPEMEHLVFNDATAEEFIAAHYGARELAAFQACAVPAMRADYFRYCACHTLGGFCVDADYQCIGPLLSAMEESVGGQLFRAERFSVLINSLFGFHTPRHPFLDLVIEIATELIEQRFTARVSEITGPGIFTILYHLHRFPTKSNQAFLRYLEEGIEPGSAESDGFAQQSLSLLRAPRLRDLAGRIAAVVGHRDRLDRAFDGVRVSPGRAIHRLVRQPEAASMPYKDSEDDWNRVGIDQVYREVGQ